MLNVMGILRRTPASLSGVKKSRFSTNNLALASITAGPPFIHCVSCASQLQINEHDDDDDDDGMV